MPVEVGLWRIDTVAERIRPGSMPLESRLEQLILDDPEILGSKLLLIGNQVPTRYGKFADVLGLDLEGNIHILELKRDKTPRDVVAQILDYATWVQELGNDDIRDIFTVNHPAVLFDEAFAERFDGAPVPDELNGTHSLTVVASDTDTATERIVMYLNQSYGVPINIMKFQYFRDGDHEYLARTWVVDEASAVKSPSASRTSGTRASWNGRDWYVAFGEGRDRHWDDAKRFGFVSAGGGEWYSRTLKSLPEGARVFVHVPQRGYVGVGVVEGPAQPADDAVLSLGGQQQPFRSLPVTASYSHGDSESGDVGEYIVPVRWLHTVPLESAVWRQGMFANQNSACKLRSKFTIEEVSKAFGLTEESL
ncbi:hypothetical protein [Sinomonas halotolerans]|uniref:DUF91 domain-containing protein n=1 Tax=Sinomonas halotolerans TaxID=1644133 RepID=A0ABU9X1U2_9MICC